MELFFHYPWIPFWVIWTGILLVRRVHPVKALVLPPLYVARWVLCVVAGLVVGLFGALGFSGLARWYDWR